MTDSPKPPEGMVFVRRPSFSPNQRVMHPSLGPGRASGAKNPKTWWSNYHHKYLKIDHLLQDDEFDEKRFLITEQHFLEHAAKLALAIGNDSFSELKAKQFLNDLGLTPEQASIALDIGVRKGKLSRTTNSHYRPA